MDSYRLNHCVFNFHHATLNVNVWVFEPIGENSAAYAQVKQYGIPKKTSITFRYASIYFFLDYPIGLTRVKLNLVDA